MAKLYNNNRANLIDYIQLYNKMLTHNQTYNNIENTNNSFYIIQDLICDMYLRKSRRMIVCTIMT